MTVDVFEEGIEVMEVYSVPTVSDDSLTQRGPVDRDVMYQVLLLWSTY